jgi:hypothetical protein
MQFVGTFDSFAIFISHVRVNFMYIDKSFNAIYW